MSYKNNITGTENKLQRKETTRKTNSYSETQNMQLSTKMMRKEFTDLIVKDKVFHNIQYPKKGITVTVDRGW